MVDSSSGESFLGKLNSDVTPKRPGEFLIYIHKSLSVNGRKSHIYSSTLGREIR